MADLYNVAVQRYTGGGVEWADAGRDYRVLLLKSTGPPTFDATHATLADVLGHANNDEADDASYSRYTIPDGDRSVTNTARKSQAHIDNPADFGSIENETIGAAVVYEHIDGTDANDIPVAFLTSDDFPIVTNGAGFTIEEGADGLFEIEGVSA